MFLDFSHFTTWTFIIWMSVGFLFFEHFSQTYLGRRVELTIFFNDGRLTHVALKCLLDPTYGYQSCKIMTKKSRVSHQTKLLNLLHNNLWTSNKNRIYILHHFFLMFNHAPKKLKHNKISVVWLKTSCIYFLSWCSFCHWTVVELTRPLPSLHLQIPTWVQYFRP